MFLGSFFNLFLCVAPRAGAWIEIFVWRITINNAVVAPRAGAWIEIFKHPEEINDNEVAPRAGAWIEIFESEN